MCYKIEAVFFRGILLCLFILTPVLSGGVFERFTTRDGLPENTVTCFLQDAHGLLWMGTPQGLSRFDGMHFRNFYADERDSLGFPDDNITALFQYSQTIILISTGKGLLIQYDYTAGKFTNLSRRPELKKIQWNNGIRARNGEIWFATDEGIALLDASLRRVTQYKLNDFLPAQNSFGVCHNLAEDAAGNFWIATFSRQLVKFDRAAKRFSQPFYPRFPLYQVHEVIASPDGAMIYGATGGRGLLIVDTRTGSARELAVPLPSGQAELSLLCLADYEAEKLLIGSQNGLILYNTRAGTSEFYANDPANFKSLADNNIHALYRMRDGTVWVSSLLALHRAVLSPPVFRKITREPSGKSLFAGSAGQFMLEFENGAKILGTNGALNITDTRGKVRKAYVLRNTSGTYDHIGPFGACRAGGYLWIGAWGGGVFRLKYRVEGESVTLSDEKQFTWQKDNPLSLPSDFINSIAEDEKGNIWIATWGGGLACIPAGEIHKYSPAITRHSFSKLTGSRMSNYTSCLTPVGNETLLLISEGKLVAYETATRKIKIMLDGADPLAVPRGIYRGEDGVCFIGLTGGLARLPGGTGNVEMLVKEKEGAGEQVIRDARGFLWTISFKGKLCRFDAAGKSVQYLDLYDAVEGFRPSYGFSGRDSRGNIYFSAATGFLVFHPDSLRVSPLPAPPKITSVTLTPPPGKSYPDPLLTNEIEVDYNNSAVEIKFSALNFTNASENHYRTRLLGADDEWSEAGHRAEVTYSKLAPGRYVFEAAAAGADRVWQEMPARLVIVVRPPFYLTWWFRIAGLAGITLLIWLYSRRKITAAEKEKSKQQEFSARLIETQESERARVARELHDSIGQNLLVIKNLLGLYKKKSGAEDNDLNELDGIIAGSIAEVRGISSSLHPHQFIRLGVAPAVRAMAETISRSTGMEVNVQTVPDNPQLNEKAAIVVFRLIQEALNNAAKHSGAKAVSIALSLEQDTATIEIADDGRGMDGKENGGMGMMNMRERVKSLNGLMEIHSSAGAGTKLIFTFERKDIEG